MTALAEALVAAQRRALTAMEKPRKDQQIAALITQAGYPSGATAECAHDWRLNPVVVATATPRDRELWTCAKRCGAQLAGPELSSVPSSRPVVWNDPTTWDRRG